MLTYIGLCLIAFSADNSRAAASQPELANALVWATGERDPSGPPRGKLLSDNAGYWGDVVLTGATYTWESNPDNPTDRLMDNAAQFGRRLLDGRIEGNWWVPVGQNPGHELIAVFDFHRPCQFSEVDTIASRTPKTSLKIEVRATQTDPWTTVFTQSLDKSLNKPLNRAILPGNSAGRYMRLSLGSDGITWLDEVLVWGEADVSPQYPEHIAQAYRRELPSGVLCSIPGMKTTEFPAARIAEWRSSTGPHASAPAVWSSIAQASPRQPILPEAAVINPTVHVVMARNETESLYLALTNTSATDSRVVTINDVPLRAVDSNEPEASLRAKLLIGGALPTAAPKQPLTAEQRLRLMVDASLPDDTASGDEVGILPFFDRGQMLGRSLMQRYLANGVEIRDFPQITLPPGGSAVFMLRVTTAETAAGQYAGSISATASDGQTVATPLQIEVSDVTLPDLDLWVHSWGNATTQFPFETQSRCENDVRASRELGVTAFMGFPLPGSKAALFGSMGRTFYHATGIPADFVGRGYAGQLQPGQITIEDEKRIAEHLQGLSRQANQLGLRYDDWWVELWDEPQETNTATFEALARILRRTDPRIRIYMNPLFWRPGHAPDDVIVAHLAPWYCELIDLSVPIMTLIGDNRATRELWSTPRYVRAFYIHPAARGGRAMAWKAYDLGYNGWGYYCYHAPRGNPWDIRTWTELGYSYQMVFPGPQGPIVMPIYEEMRDGWEDYRLLAALRQRGREDIVRKLLSGYREGESLTELRVTGLRSAKAEQQP
jgi:hypothetical protein